MEEIDKMKTITSAELKGVIIKNINHRGVYVSRNVGKIGGRYYIDSLKINNGEFSVIVKPLGNFSSEFAYDLETFLELFIEESEYEKGKDQNKQKQKKNINKDIEKMLDTYEFTEFYGTTIDGRRVDLSLD